MQEKFQSLLPSTEQGPNRIAEDGAGNELGSGMKKERVNSPERSEEQKLQLRSWVQSVE